MSDVRPTPRLPLSGLRPRDLRIPRASVRRGGAALATLALILATNLRLPPAEAAVHHGVRAVHDAGTAGDAGIGAWSVRTVDDAGQAIDDINEAEAVLASQPTAGTDTPDVLDYSDNFPGVSGDDFALEATGIVDVLSGTSGTFTLYVNSDDGFRLRLNGAVIGEFVTPTAASNVTIPNVTLNDGDVLRLTYFERGGGEYLRFRLGDDTGPFVGSTASGIDVGPPTVTLAAAGWQILAAPGDAETVGAFFGPVWTQGFPGADGETATLNIYFYDETAAGAANVGYGAPASASTAIPAGVGVFAYIFADDDFDGSDDPFPKALPLAGAEPGLPFTWGSGGDAPLSYTNTGSAVDDGWNLLGNPLRGVFSWNDTWDNGASSVSPTAEAYISATNTWSTFNAQTNVLTGDQFTPSGELAEGVGFFVQTTGASPTMTAPATAPRTSPEDVTPHVAVRIASADGPATEFAVALFDGATFGYDVGETEVRLPPATPYVAAGAVTEPDGLAFSSAMIPGAGALTTGAELEVAVGAVDIGPVQVSWRVELPDGWTATLLDRQSGAEVAMAEGGTYAADLSDAAAEPEPGRFALRLSPGTAVAAEDGAVAGTVSLVYPNPAARRADLVVTPTEAGDLRAVVYDALGREVGVTHDGPVTGTVRLDLGVARLAPGTYVVRVTGAGLSASRSFTVVR